MAFSSSWISISAAISAASESVCQTATCAVNLKQISWRSGPETNSMYLNSLSLINKVSMARASAALSTWASLWEHKGTKVVGYQCQWMTPPFPSHHHSPIEGSVRFMLEHFIEIFQCFYLSCCLKVTHKEPMVTSFQRDSVLWWKCKFSQLTNHMAVTLVSESLLVTVGSERISAKQYAFRWVSSLWWVLIVSFWAPQLWATFERVLVTRRRVHQHELGPILQQDLVVLSHRLFQKVGDELVLHKPWAGNKDALHH